MEVQSIASNFDVNIAILRHAGDASGWTQRAAAQIERVEFLVPAVVLLDLETLYEKSAINVPVAQVLSDLNQQIGGSVCQFPVAVVMSSALQVKWTREPGDRIIVADAIANNEAPLITSDRRIRENYLNSIW